LADHEAGLHDLLTLPDERLVRALDDRDKYQPFGSVILDNFRSARQEISNVTWDAFATALDCDRGPIAKTGVHWQLLNEATAERLMSIFNDSPVTTLRRDDFVLGHMATLTNVMVTQLNAANQYREATPAFVAAVGELLADIGPEIGRLFGHPWRVGSLRQFELQPGAAGGRHLDNWPLAMRKLFILPRGATRRSGTTWFRMRDGKEMMLDSEKPIWAIFENSAVDHSLISSEIGRPTIEVDLVPALETSTDPYYAGINGWYPWFPTEKALLEGTRIAFTLALKSKIPAEQETPGALSRLVSPIRRLFS
jgi:hypothetical protein